MKITYNKILAALIGFVISNNYAQDTPAIPQARIGLRLVDEMNTPVVNYPCGIGLYTFSEENGKTAITPYKGNTNIKGEYWAEGPALPNMGAGLGFSREGYYTSSRVTEFKKIEDGKLLPFGLVNDLVIKRIGKPVPMYAVANCSIILPEKEGSFGYDLERRDWVAPRGGGAKSDLIFTQEKKEDAEHGSLSRLRISFSNLGDGIIPLYELHGAESELNLPRSAPTEGYEAEHQLTPVWGDGTPFKMLTKPVLGYLYRVRTVLDESGKVKSAWYGKMDGEFWWVPRWNELKFTYYLNPDGTTNLEFNRKKNLSHRLELGNIVHRP
jgi:hypothetical protein